MANLEERLEALEAQNRALLGRIGELEGSSARRGPAPGSSSVDAVEQLDDARVDRRKLLRNLGGAAAAGLGLFAAQSVASPQPALADHLGQDMIAGHSHTSTRTTSLSSDHSESTGSVPFQTLELVNTGTGPALNVKGGGGVAPLTLEVQSSEGGADTGSLAAVGDDSYANLKFAHSGDSFKTNSDAIVGTVLTTNFAQYVDFPSGFPKRAVETRSSQGEKNHPTGSGSLSSGTYTIDISSEVPSGTSGILGAITVVPQNNANGFLRFWPEGTEPDTANLAWSSGQLETTSASTAITSTGTFQLRVSGDIHLVVDLMGVIKNT